jgi:hypothetical protein
MAKTRATKPSRTRTRKTTPGDGAQPRRSSRGHKLNAFPDTLDFRDRMYVPTLVEVPTMIDLKQYRKLRVPILNQGREGACTGFGLATVANYLLRRRKVVPDTTCVSPRMFYEMAKRYDDWPGEDYDGSSARGAMKGWNKHGVCAEHFWEYDHAKQKSAAFAERWTDAVRRPMGAYFRVNHTDLVAMHSAIAEVGVLYATSTVHAGWDRVGKDGVIPQSQSITGGHAFAIVAYDEHGFWIQNSWGDKWGLEGFGRISYDDWLANATDTWVARLGAPVVLLDPHTTAAAVRGTARGSQSYVFSDLRPHIVSLGNDGQPRSDGTYGTTAKDIETIFDTDFSTITSGWPKKFGKRRLLLYAHGGLVSEDSAIQMVADDRETLVGTGIYPVSFLWKTDYLDTLKDILEDALHRRRPEGALDATKDFMLERLDDALEPLARIASGLLEWSQMKQNAIAATASATGGARVAAGCIDSLMKADSSLELHLVGHSAGSIFLAPLVQLLTEKGSITQGPLAGSTGFGRTIASCTLWAPACTMDLFHQLYAPAIEAGQLRRFSLFTLTDQAERDDNCANIYHKSLLYLVSNAFENRPRIPLVRDGVPILGMEKFAKADAELVKLVGGSWVHAPNTAAMGSPDASGARHHGDFHTDPATLRATLARILAGDPSGAARARSTTIRRHASASAVQSRRQAVDTASRA